MFHRIKLNTCINQDPSACLDLTEGKVKQKVMKPINEKLYIAGYLYIFKLKNQNVTGLLNDHCWQTSEWDVSYIILPSSFYQSKS